MPKKIKLNLKDLKVQSFVTALNEEEKKKVGGGTEDENCESGVTCPYQLTCPIWIATPYYPCSVAQQCLLYCTET